MGRLITELFKENTALAIVAIILDMLIGCIFAKKFYPARSRRVLDARGTRNQGLKLRIKCSLIIGKGMAACEKRLGESSLLKRARDKMRKAGYKGEYAAIIYFFAKYVFSPAVFLAAFITNFPDIIRPAASAVLLNVVMESVISARKRKNSLRFQKYIYKIYKYLHNQVSSGISPPTP